MSTYVSNRDGGQTDEQGHYRFQTKVWSGNVLQGFATSQNSPLGMSVIVSQGDIKINYSSYAYTAFSDSDTVVTITTANGSNPRIDRLVAYIDRGMTPSPLSPNNPNMLKFKVIAGVPGAIPVRPSDSDVNTDVGPSNPWTSLSDILVDTSVTTIINSKITDKRNFVTVAYAKLLSTIFSGQLTTYTNPGTAGGTFYYGDIGGIKIFYGKTQFNAVGTGGASYTITLPVGFFSTIRYSAPTVDTYTIDDRQWATTVTVTTATYTLGIKSSSNGSTQVTNVLILGT